ncbi:TPA: DUF2877 domain-containing protein [Candidatus Bathyarchaeota archaeon]|nr:DUF2877 domain-containing protein [Candidatus Bathyarchaeota archaeon]
MRSIRAISVGSTASRVLRRDVVGEVQSVFDRTFNVAFPEPSSGDITLIGIARGGMPNGPFNIVTDVPKSRSMRAFDIDRGIRVKRVGESLLVGDRLSVQLGNARVWRPRTHVNNPSDVRDILRALEVVRGIAINNVHKGGLGQMLLYLDEVLADRDARPFLRSDVNHVTRMALPSTISLIGAIRSGNREGIGLHVRNLIGLGPGLSPSADDMLAGFMAALWWMANTFGKGIEYVKDVNTAIARSATKTTLLSRQILRHAAVGEVNEAIEGLLGSVLTAQDDSVRVAVKDALAIGESSGMDTIVGILLGFYAGAAIVTRVGR